MLLLVHILTCSAPVMERSEPSFVPEWLRSPGGSSLSHHVSSSKTDGPLLALPKRNRTLNNTSHSDTTHSSLLERSSSTNSRRSSSSNGSSKHDNNPYSRSYSSSARNQRSKDREKLGISDTWDSEYSDTLSSIIGVRTEKDTLRRSQSLISRRPEELQRRPYTNLRNRGHNNNGSENGIISVGSASTGTQKVSFERDFPLLGSDERPTTPDVARVPSPGLSRGVQGLSIGTSPLIGGEGWTSALAEVPAVGSNSIGSSPSLQPASCAAGGQPSNPSTSSEAAAPNGLNMAEALVQGPVRPQNVPQSVLTPRFEELPSVGVKKLIPMTSSMPKTLVLNPSDKLKPKTAARSIDGVAGPKNGVQQLPSLQLGNQVVRGGSTRAEGLNSSSSGKLQVLKPGREKVVSPVLKDPSAQTTKVTNAIANGPSPGSPSAASHPSKNPNNLKHPNNERKTSAYTLNGVQVVDKRSQAQLQSRMDFFNLVRKKSMGSTSAAADSGPVVSSVLQNSGEQKEMASVPVSPTENGREVNCNGDTSVLDESFSDQRGSDLSHHELIHPEEELHFLRALGWEDDGGDEEGLTEEEIKTFVEKYMKWRPESKLLQGLQLKIMAESNPPASCSTGSSSSELRTADSSL